MPPKSFKADGTPKQRWSAADRSARGHAPRRRGGQPRGRAADATGPARHRDAKAAPRTPKSGPDERPAKVRHPRPDRAEWPGREARTHSSRRYSRTTGDDRPRTDKFGAGPTSRSAPSWPEPDSEPSVAELGAEVPHRAVSPSRAGPAGRAPDLGRQASAGAADPTATARRESRHRRDRRTARTRTARAEKTQSPARDRPLGAHRVRGPADERAVADARSGRGR